jgi:hypothetical protein
LPSLPPAGIPQGGAATPQSDLLQPEEVCERGGIHSFGTWYFIYLPGDLAGVLGDIETGNAANAGSAREKTIRNGIQGMP